MDKSSSKAFVTQLFKGREYGFIESQVIPTILSYKSIVKEELLKAEAVQQKIITKYANNKAVVATAVQLSNELRYTQLNLDKSNPHSFWDLNNRIVAFDDALESKIISEIKELKKKSSKWKLFNSSEEALQKKQGRIAAYNILLEKFYSDQEFKNLFESGELDYSISLKSELPIAVAEHFPEKLFDFVNELEAKLFLKFDDLRALAKEKAENTTGQASNKRRYLHELYDPFLVKIYKGQRPSAQDQDLLTQYIRSSQQYQVFVYDSHFAVSTLQEMMADDRKQSKARYTKALATERVDRQRGLARTERSESQYNRQITVFDKCPYCRESLGAFSGKLCAELDHIYPVSRGGLSVEKNLVFICSSCNRAKRDETLSRFIKKRQLKRTLVERVLDDLDKDY